LHAPKNLADIKYARVILVSLCGAAEDKRMTYAYLYFSLDGSEPGPPQPARI